MSITLLPLHGAPIEDSMVTKKARCSLTTSQHTFALLKEAFENDSMGDTDYTSECPWSPPKSDRKPCSTIVLNLFNDDDIRRISNPIFRDTSPTPALCSSRYIKYYRFLNMDGEPTSLLPFMLAGCKMYNGTYFPDEPLFFMAPRDGDAASSSDLVFKVLGLSIDAISRIIHVAIRAGDRIWWYKCSAHPHPSWNTFHMEALDIARTRISMRKLLEERNSVFMVRKMIAELRLEPDSELEVGERRRVIGLMRGFFTAGYVTRKTGQLAVLICDRAGIAPDDLNGPVRPETALALGALVVAIMVEDPTKLLDLLHDIHIDHYWFTSDRLMALSRWILTELGHQILASPPIEHFNSFISLLICFPRHAEATLLIYVNSIPHIIDRPLSSSIRNPNKSQLFDPNDLLLVVWNNCLIEYGQGLTDLILLVNTSVTPHIVVCATIFAHLIKVALLLLSNQITFDVFINLVTTERLSQILRQIDQLFDRLKSTNHTYSNEFHRIFCFCTANAFNNPELTDNCALALYSGEADLPLNKLAEMIQSRKNRIGFSRQTSTQPSKQPFAIDKWMIDMVGQP